MPAQALKRLWTRLIPRGISVLKHKEKVDPLSFLLVWLWAMSQSGQASAIEWHGAMLTVSVQVRSMFQACWLLEGVLCEKRLGLGPILTRRLRLFHFGRLRRCHAIDRLWCLPSNDSSLFRREPRWTRHNRFHRWQGPTFSKLWHNSIRSSRLYTRRTCATHGA
jgi:hypothetical protein